MDINETARGAGRFVLDPDPVAMESVADEAMGHGNVCVMCTTKAQAVRVFLRWLDRGAEGAVLVTDGMPDDMLEAMVGLVKSRQDGGKPVRVACTPVLEMGCNLDFEHFYRAAAGLPHLLQSSGRHNRHGKYQPGPMRVFVPEDMDVPAGLDAASIAGETDPERISDYCRALAAARQTPAWKTRLRVANGPRHDYVLEMPHGLRLEVVQTSLRSETSDREYDVALFRTEDSSQSCLWHAEHVPERPGKDIRAVAGEMVLERFGRELRRTGSLLADLKASVGKASIETKP